MFLLLTDLLPHIAHFSLSISTGQLLREQLGDIFIGFKLYFSCLHTTPQRFVLLFVVVDHLRVFDDAFVFMVFIILKQLNREIVVES
jgi:hypothetical protein